MVPYTSGTFSGTTSPDPWVPWNHIHFDTSCADSDTTNVTICAATWHSWNDSYTAIIRTDASTSTTLWSYWNNRWTQAHPYAVPLCETQLESIRQAVQPTAEQQAQWRKIEEQQAQRREEEQKQLAEAKKRADVLLKAHLTPQQWEELEEKNCFHLFVGDKKYRINRGRSQNIQLLNSHGLVVKTLCAHPSEMIPDADTMLVQKLMLENAEQDFLRIAYQS